MVYRVRVSSTAKVLVADEDGDVRVLTPAQARELAAALLEAAEVCGHLPREASGE